MRLKVFVLAMMVCAMLASVTVITLVAVTVLAAPHIETILHIEEVAPAPKQAQPAKMTHPAMFQESGPTIQHPNHDPDHRGGGGCKNKQTKTDDL